MVIFLPDILTEEHMKDLNNYSIVTSAIINLINSATKRQLGNLDVYSLSDFIRCSKISTETLVTALIFVEKFLLLKPKPHLFSEITATELLIIATMAASKYLHDTDSEEAMCNIDWSTEFDIELKLLNKLEVRFLHSLDWNLFISKDEFEIFVSKLFNVDNNAASGKLGKCTQAVCEDHASSFRSKYHNDRHTKAQWPMAKAVTVFAAAFLAVSQPPVSMLSMDVPKIGGNALHAGSLVGVSQPRSTIDNQRPPRNMIDQLTAFFARLVVPPLSDASQAEVIPNSSSFEALVQRFNTSYSSSCAYSLLRDEEDRPSSFFCGSSVSISVGVG